MKFTALFVFTLSLVGILGSALDYRVEKTSQGIHKKASFLSGNTPRYLNRSVDEEISDLYQSWDTLSSLAVFVPQVHYQLGRATLVLSLTAGSNREKVELFCEAFQHFRRAAQLSPHNPLYQIAWADIDGQIPNRNLVCSDLESTDSSTLSTTQRLRWAEKLAPFSVNNLYFAAVVNLGIGNKEQALRLLRTTQEINPRFSARQREYTYSLVQSEEELKLALPTRYPESLRWVWYFAKNRERDYLAWKDSFAAGIEGTILDLKNRYRKGELDSDSFSSFMKTVSALPLIAETEQIRRPLDEIMANIYEVEGDEFWAQTLRERASLARLPVLKALIVDDLQPKRSMLFGWVPDVETRLAELDTLGRSLGLYIPRRHRVRMLILQSSEANARLRPEEIEILGSRNNLDFNPLDIKDSIEKTSVDGKETLVVRLETSDFRYLKVRYLGSNKKARFRNRFSDLIQIYGGLQQ